MPEVENIVINVPDHGTTATATFNHFTDGEWRPGVLDFIRITGSRKWKHVHNPDVPAPVITAVKRKLKAGHSALPPGVLRHPLSVRRTASARVTVAPDPLADMRLHDLPLSSYRAVVNSAARAQRPPVTHMTPVTPREQGAMPTSCDCVTHTNQYVHGSGRWRSHALSFGCVGA